MEAEIVKYPALVVWIIGVLLSVISLLAGFLLWYVLQLIKEARSLRGSIDENTKEIIALKDKNTDLFSQIHTSTKSLWEGIINIQRTLGETNMVLDRRRTEIDRLREDTNRSERKLAEHKQVHKAGLKLFRDNNEKHQRLKTEVQSITKDLIFVKNKIEGES